MIPEIVKWGCTLNWKQVTKEREYYTCDLWCFIHHTQIMQMVEAGQRIFIDLAWALWTFGNILFCIMHRPSTLDSDFFGTLC